MYTFLKFRCDMILESNGSHCEWWWDEYAHPAKSQEASAEKCEKNQTKWFVCGEVAKIILLQFLL